MKPEDRKRLKQHIEMIVEHKEPTQSQTEKILRDAVEEQIKGKIELEDKNRKLRLELHTLRFKEAQENRFVWWIYQVYARHVSDLLTELERTTFPATPFGMSNTVKRLREYTEHIYDGTYLDTAMSTEQSSSDLSTTRGVSTDIKTPSSIENTNPDYYKQELARRDALIERLVEVGNDIVEEAQVQEPDVQELRDNWRVLIAEWKASKDGGGE